MNESLTLSGRNESDLKDTIRVLDARKPEPRKSGWETKLPDKLGVSKMSILAR